MITCAAIRKCRGLDLVQNIGKGIASLWVSALDFGEVAVVVGSNRRWDFKGNVVRQFDQQSCYSKMQKVMAVHSIRAHFMQSHFDLHAFIISSIMVGQISVDWVGIFPPFGAVPLLRCLSHCVFLAVKRAALESEAIYYPESVCLGGIFSLPYICRFWLNWGQWAAGRRHGQWESVPKRL